MFTSLLTPFLYGTDSRANSGSERVLIVQTKVVYGRLTKN
jgi:hypothetical protein